MTTLRATMYRIVVRVSLAVILGALSVAVCKAQDGPQPVVVPVLPKSCRPLSQLHGRDTIMAYMPCNSLDVLPPGMRLAVECTLGRMKRGGWDAVVFETWRSDERQKFLYAYGRTRPGPRVTNARDAFTTVHHYRLAVDIVHRKRLWNHPKFFYWLMQHAEACGMVAGAAWTRFPDQPHIQFGAWAGAPPQWARDMIVHDSLPAIWRRVGASNQ